MASLSHPDPHPNLRVLAQESESDSDSDSEGSDSDDPDREGDGGEAKDGVPPKRSDEDTHELAMLIVDEVHVLGDGKRGCVRRQ